MGERGKRAFQMSALVGGLAAAGAGGYALKPAQQLSDEEVLAHVMERAGRGDFQDMLTEIREAREAEAPEPERAVPYWVKRTRMIRQAPEHELRMEPGARCRHCDVMSERSFRDGPAFLRTCPSCERDWTMTLSPNGRRAVWFGDRWFPTYQVAMRESTGE